MNSESLHIASRAMMILLLDSMARGMVVLLAVGGAVCFMRRTGAASRHRLWILAISATGLMPLLILLPGWHVLPPRELQKEMVIEAPQLPLDTAALEPAAIERIAPIGTKARRDVPPPEMSRPLLPVVISLAAALWAIGAAVMGGRLLLSRFTLATLARRASPASDELQSLMDSAATQLSMNRRVRLLQAADMSIMPMTWGLLRPTILLPASCREWSKSRRRMVILHELSHTKRSDYAWVLLAEVVAAIYWFNPLWRWALNQLRDEAEQACDEAVLAAGEDRCSYADELLATVKHHVRGGRTTALALGMSRCSTLEARLKLILDPRPASTPHRSALVAPMVVLLIAAPLSQIRLEAQTRPASSIATDKPVAAPSTAPAEQGISYGGTLSDTDGKPISGAQLALAWQVPHHLGVFEKTAITDAAGRWEVSVDKSWTISDIRAAEPGYVRLLIQKPDEDLLKAHKLAVTFEHPVTVTGYIRDEQGNPIVGALIEPPLIWSRVTRVNGQRQQDPPPIYTGQDGKFTVEGLSPHNTRLYISANTFAPALVTPKDPSRPVIEMLSTGGQVSGVVIGLDGKPKPNAMVMLSDWQLNGLHHFIRTARSDDNGRFTLLHIPESGSMWLQMPAPNACCVGIRVTAGEGHPYQVQMVRPAKAHVSLVDDVTGKPITAFNYSVSEPTPNPDEIRFFFNRTNIDSGDGTFNVETKTRSIYLIDQPFRVRVYADGYRPEDSPIFRINSESFFTLRMKKAMMLSGRVVNADGLPASNVQVAWVRPQSHAFVAANGRLDTNYAYAPDSIVTADARGQFENLQATSIAGNVVATGPSGYAVVSADAFGKDNRLILTPWTSVHGKMLRRDKPMVNQRVSLSETGAELVIWASRTTLVAADGAYRFNHLPVGLARVLVESDGKAHQGDIDLHPGRDMQHDYFRND